MCNLDYILWDFIFRHLFLILLHILYHIGIIIAVNRRKYVQINTKDYSEEDDQQHQEEEAEQAEERGSDCDKQEEEQEMIRLEPRTIYDAAIIDQDGDRLVYCYDRLIDVLVEDIRSDSCIDIEEAFDQAADHIHVNIIGSSVSFPEYPIIKHRDENEQSQEE